MRKTEAAHELRHARALDLPAVSADRARDALDQVRRRTQEVRARAQGRARAAIDRRRTAAAARLEGLAGALRPEDPAGVMRARRKAAAVAGASSVVLVAALGIGVALGFMLSRRLKERAELRARVAASELPAGMAGQESMATPAAALDF